MCYKFYVAYVACSSARLASHTWLNCEDKISAAQSNMLVLSPEVNVRTCCDWAGCKLKLDPNISEHSQADELNPGGQRVLQNAAQQNPGLFGRCLGG